MSRAGTFPPLRYSNGSVPITFHLRRGKDWCAPPCYRFSSDRYCVVAADSHKSGDRISRTWHCELYTMLMGSDMKLKWHLAKDKWCLIWEIIWDNSIYMTLWMLACSVEKGVPMEHDPRTPLGKTFAYRPDWGCFSKWLCKWKVYQCRWNIHFTNYFPCSTKGLKHTALYKIKFGCVLKRDNFKSNKVYHGQCFEAFSRVTGSEMKPTKYVWKRRSATEILHLHFCALSWSRTLSFNCLVG